MSAQKKKKSPIPVLNTNSVTARQAAPGKANKITARATDVIETSEYATHIKEETLRWIFSIIGSLLVYAIVANVILKVYHPDINALLALAKKIGATGLAAPRPEPMEALLFRAGILTILPCILGFYTLFSKTSFVVKLAKTPFFIVFSTLCALVVIFIIYNGFAAQNPFANGGGDQPQNSRDFVGRSNFDFYFDGLFLGNNMLLYACLLVPAITCIFYFGYKKFNWAHNKIFNSVSSLIGYSVLGGTVLSVVLMNTFYFPYAPENKYDFNAIYYSMTQVYAGSAMLVDGFTNTYGLYPQFLNPLFHLIGFDVFKVSLVLSLITACCFVLNFLFLRRLVSNKIILFLGFATILFFPFLDFKFLTGFDASFAFFPIRYIIPSTLTFMAGLYFFKRSKAIYWLIFVLMSFAVLWNPEIGVVSFLAWLAANTYTDFFTQEGRVAYKKMFFHWMAGIGTLICAILFYKVVIYLFYGASPDLGLLAGTILDFEKLGLGLLPMPLAHPWNIEALILILGFVYAIIRWYKKEVTPKASIVLLLSVLGLGFLVYYQGRSHNWQFAGSSSFALALLVILGDELWEIVKKANVLALHVLFVIFLFLISASFFEIITNTAKINDMIYQEDDKTKQQDEEARIKSNEDFIIKNTHEKEKIFVLTAPQYQGLYFNGNKRLSAFNPGIEDLFLTEDLERLEKKVRNGSYSIFLEPELAKSPVMARVLPAVAATYDLAGVNQSMVFLKKRTAKMPAASFFSDSGLAVFHHKYNDDTAGIGLRINDAFGNVPISLSAEFSVEILFNARTQIYPYASLAGNMNDSCGFLIANVPNSSNYFFGINGKGLAIAVPNNQWVYLVMNVYPDHFEAYINGNPTGTFPLPHPMCQSPEKISVGNLGYWRYYLGPIAEVAVINKAMDKGQVQSTWEKIKGAAIN